MGRKHCGKRRNCFMSNFSFSHSVFKRLALQTYKNPGLFGKGLSTDMHNILYCCKMSLFHRHLQQDYCLFPVFSMISGDVESISLPSNINIWCNGNFCYCCCSVVTHRNQRKRNEGMQLFKFDPIPHNSDF